MAKVNGRTGWTMTPGQAEDELANQRRIRHPDGPPSGSHGALNERERHHPGKRKLTDEPKTLEELVRYNVVSRERIRQIEVRAFEKLQKAMKRMAKEQGLPTGN
jgi:RNA polymerase sigma-32 factor